MGWAYHARRIYLTFFLNSSGYHSFPSLRNRLEGKAHMTTLNIMFLLSFRFFFSIEDREIKFAHKIRNYEQ